jgi:protein O-GlcNAc transferase
MNRITRKMEEAKGLYGRRQFQAAAQAFQNVIAEAPTQGIAWYFLAGCQQQLQQLAAAAASARRACDLETSNAAYWLYASNLYQDIRDAEQAEYCARQAVTQKPDFAQAYNNLGIILADRNQLLEAEDCYVNALKADPNYARACVNYSTVLMRTFRDAEARTLVNRAITLMPNYPHAFLNLGSIEFQQRNFAEAEVALQQALSLNPNFPDAYKLLAKVFREQAKLDQALIALDHALQLRPNEWDTHNERGDVLAERGEHSLSVQVFKNVLAHVPNDLKANLRIALTLPVFYESAQHLQHSRDHYEQRLTLLAANPQRFVQGTAAELIKNMAWNNFYLAYQGQDDLDLQRQYAAFQYALLQTAAPQHLLPILPTAPHPSAPGKIRVGFASRSFYNCTVGAYFGNWITRLDKAKFEIYVYYTNGVIDDVSKNIATSADHYHHVKDAVLELAQTIKNDALDVLIYPEMGMDPNLFTMAGLRLAPVQACAWGHPMTTGHTNMDYYFSCAQMEAENAQAAYSERLALLPGVGTYYEKPPEPIISAGQPSLREELSIGTDAVLALYPQSLFKIHPDCDALIAKVMVANPSLVLIMFAGRSPQLTNSFIARFKVALKQQGMDEAHMLGRIKILPSVDHNGYKRINQACDFMLDTLYWSGGNTSLDALARGLPIVTLPSAQMRGRQTMAMLKLLEVTELIAKDGEDYVQIAGKLAADRAWRAKLAAKIRANEAALFADEAPIKALEQYLENWVAKA